MAITEALRLLITADSAGAVKGIEQVGRTADRELSRSEKSLDRWGNRLTTVGAGLVAFGAVAAAGLHSAAQSAGELEQAVGGTEAVFKDASGIIDDYAGKAAEAAGLSENEFRIATTAIGGNLKRMGLDVDEAASKSVELTQTAADLAATYGGTTAEAVQALGAAFRGEADPAERFNLDLKVSKVNAEAVALGLASSTAAVDDNARAQALLSLITKQSADAQGQFGRESDTLAGRQQILAAEFENLKAEIGEGVVPAMETLFGVASRGIDVFSGLNDATGGTLGQIATIGTVASLGIGGLSILVGQAIKMRSTFKDAAGAVSNFAGSGGLGRLAGAVGRGGALVGGLLLLDQVLDQVISSDPRAADIDKLDTMLRRFGRTAQVSGELADVAGDDFGKLKDAFDTLNSSSPSDVLDRTNDRLNSVLSTVTLGAADASTAVEEAQQTFDDFDTALAGIAERDPGMAFDILTAAAQAAGISVEDLKGELPEYAGAVDEAKESAAEAGVEVDEFGVSMDGAAEATDNAKSALEEYNDQLEGLFDPLYGAIDAANGLRDANQEVADKTAELTAAEAEFGVGSAEATAAAQALSDAQFGASEAALDQEMALRRLKEHVDEHPGSIDAAKAKLAEWVAQGGITQESADATARELDALAMAAAGVTEDVNIDVSASGVQYVIGQLDELARAVNRSSGGRFRVSVGGGGGLTMHEGGYVPGPRGQEVAAILQAGERVLSLDEVDAMSRGVPAAAVAGGGPTRIDMRMVISGEGGLAAQIAHAERAGELRFEVNGERVRVSA